jgi:hypothetical protein
MKIKTLGWLLAVTAIASSASIVACSQAAVQCQAGHSGLGLGFAAKYYPVGTPGMACTLTGDEIGLETYHPPGGGDDGTQPDFSVPSGVAVKTSAMGNLIADKAKKGSKDDLGTNTENDDGTHTLAKHPAYSLGKFSTIEPVDDFCPVTGLAPAEQSFPPVKAVPPDPKDPDDMGTKAEDATSVRYEWSDLKVYVTAAAQGTQFSGHLKFTQDTCSAEYNVLAVWPEVGCGSDADCCPAADPLGGRITGSGINPDFPVKCDVKLGFCVLDAPDASKLPVLNPGWDASAPQCKLTEEPAPK